MSGRGGFLRIALLAGLIAAAALPAIAQTATSTAGTVGSAATRNGFPVGGGAASLPTLAPGASAAATTTAAAAGGSVAASGAGGGFGGGGSAVGSGGTARPGGGGGENWVLCPPAGASGIAPFLTGTDLSCAPD
ncbi:MAG TPA: hypothetical protein VKQ73_07120 [Stellaceae bacterium]|nr:hypothetical protein [Stellaceae bacterium]